MRTAVTAAPCKDDNRTRLRALPRVKPKLRSSGSATTVATLGSAPGTTSNFAGLMRACHLWTYGWTFHRTNHL